MTTDHQTFPDHARETGHSSFSTNVSASASGVEVSGLRHDGIEGFVLKFTTSAFGKDRGYGVVNVHLGATDVTDLVELGRSVNRAIAALVVSEYPNDCTEACAGRLGRPNGLEVDAPEPAPVPAAIAKYAPDRLFVPVDAPERGDLYVDDQGDVCEIIDDTPDEDGDYHARVVWWTRERRSTPHAKVYWFADDEARRLWREVPASPADLAPTLAELHARAGRGDADAAECVEAWGDGR